MVEQSIQITFVDENSIKMYGKICLFLIFATFFQYKNATEVTVEQGTLIGATLLSRNGRQYHAFQGIPFAKPPIDDLRFQVTYYQHFYLFSAQVKSFGRNLKIFIACIM